MENVEHNEQSRGPKEAYTGKNVGFMHSMIMCDNRRSLYDIARQIGIIFGTIQSVLIDILVMFKVSARWVPRKFTKDQKKRRLDISMCFLSLCEDDPEECMRRVVTQGGTWDLGPSL